MPLAILQQLGLTPCEARIYEALLDLKEANASDIATKTKIYRRNVYDTLNRLMDKGLVFHILSKNENHYSPVDPGKFSELLKEKEELLAKVMPELKTRYEVRESQQEAYIYRGLEGVKNFLQDILRTGQDVFSIATKLGILDSAIRQNTNQFFKECKRKGIKIRCIFEHDLKKHQGLLEELGIEKPFYFLPKGFSTGVGIDIFGDYIVTCSGVSFEKLNPNITFFVLKDKLLAEGYRTLFHHLAKTCPVQQKRKK
ncbi:MAG: helix-turn-helix domain-containing protein [Candidatus Pacebacteria bacterium]|nr:helix-turn-helix domain-containing protein [Candidatus Paceibacterota bacterium]